MLVDAPAKPSGWLETNLGRVASITLGGTPSTEVPAFWGGEIPWMSSGDVHLRRISDVGGRISVAGLRASTATLVEPPAVAVALAGQGKTRGAVALTALRLSTNQSVALLKGRDGALDTTFLFHDLDRRYEELRARSSGGGRAGLSRRVLAAVPVNLPPPSEQRAIAEILDAADDAIRSTEDLLPKLAKLRQALLVALLTNGLDAAGRIRDPERNPEQVYESALGRIPRGWEVLTIEQLLADVEPAMRSGPFGSALLKSELVDEGIPLLGIDNVHVERFVDSYTRFVRPIKAKELSRYRVRPRDVMITIMGTVGRCCVVPDDIGEALSSKHTWTISFDDSKISPELACLQLNYAPWVLKHFRRDEQGGVMSAIRAETLRTTLLPIPPPDEAERIGRALGIASARLREDAALVDKLRLLKTGLSADLLEGRVRCTTDAGGAT